MLKSAYSDTVMVECFVEKCRLEGAWGHLLVQPSSQSRANFRFKSGYSWARPVAFWIYLNRRFCSVCKRLCLCLITVPMRNFFLLFNWNFSFSLWQFLLTFSFVPLIRAWLCLTRNFHLSSGSLQSEKRRFKRSNSNKPSSFGLYFHSESHPNGLPLNSF